MASRKNFPSEIYTGERRRFRIFFGEVTDIAGLAFYMSIYRRDKETAPELVLSTGGHGITPSAPTTDCYIDVVFSEEQTAALTADVTYYFQLRSVDLATYDIVQGVGSFPTKRMAAIA
jgi:hypothetical protein